MFMRVGTTRFSNIPMEQPEITLAGIKSFWAYPHQTLTATLVSRLMPRKRKETPICGHHQTSPISPERKQQ